MSRSRRLKQLRSHRQRNFLAFELLENRALMAVDGCVFDPTSEDLDDSMGLSNEVAFSAIVLNDVTTSPFTLPLNSKNPLGSLVYDATVSGTIATTSDVNNFTINVDSGQKITLVLDPATTLKGLVSLYDSSNNLLGSATNALGLDALIETISTGPTTDTYRIEVSSDGNATTGAYTLGLILNAREEAESHNGPTNDTVATAEDINASFISLNGSASRGAVLGTITGSDFYQFNVNAGESVTLALQSLSGGTINVALFDPAGVQVAAAIGGPTNVSRLLSSYVAPATGSYRARVTAVTVGTTYNLVVLKNADFDKEANNSFAAAQILVGTGGVLGGITPAVADEDWHSFAVNAGDSLSIQTKTPADGTGEFVSILNPKLELYNPSGALVVSGSVLADGRNESLVHAATATGNYRVRVVGEGSTIGEYFVSVTGNTGTAKPLFQATTTNPASGSSFLSPPSVYTVDFNDTFLASSLQASDLKVNGINATSVTVVDGDTALFTLPGGLGNGTHTVTIAAGAILDVQNTPIEAFTATFAVDATAPRVVATSVASNAILASGNLTYVVTFSEPMKVTNLSADDFSLHGNFRQAVGTNYVASSGSFNAAGTELTLNYTGLPDDDYTLTLIAGTTSGTNFTDLAGTALDGEFTGVFPTGNGFAGGNFAIGFDMDSSSEPYTALSAINPLGSLVYQGALVRTTAFAGDVDEFTLNVDPNQSISVIVTPMTVTTTAPTLQPRVELFSPTNTSLGSASAAAPGSIAGLQAQSTNSGGTYRIAIDGLAGTRGLFSVGVILNAAFEREDRISGNATNNTPGTAENIDGSFINLNTTQVASQRGAVIGTSDFSTAPLPVEIEPNNTQATANIAVANFEPAVSSYYHLGFKGDSSSTTDADFFSIGTLQAGDLLSVSVSGSPSARGANTDTFVRLYRGSADAPILVASNDDNGPGLDALLSSITIFTTDNYYVQVDASVKARTGTYDVGVFLENFDTAPTTGGVFVIESESNNTAATANNASTSWRAVQYLSRTESNIVTSDIDFYRYQWTAGDLITVNIDSQSALDARVNLRNAAGTIIASEDGSSVGPGADSFIYSFIVPSTGAYFVEVLPATGTGTYNVDVLLSSNSAPPVASIGEDYYSFTASAGESLSLTLTNLTAGNVDLQLIGTDGITVLAGGTGDATNVNEAISNVQVSTAGTYFVRVTGAGGVSYNLDVLRNALFDKEPNNTFAAAQNLVGNKGLLGAITSSVGTTLNATDSGYIFGDGQHNSTDNSYVLGQAQDGAGGLISVRNYFTFSLPSATPTIIGAQLRLVASVPPNGGYISLDPTETYTLYDVSASASALDTTRGAGDSTGIGIYSDLGTGMVYGSRVMSAADDATTVSIPLSADGVARLNAAIGTTVSLGGAITTLTGIETQILFASTSGAAGQVQLVLQTAAESDWYSFAVNIGDSLNIQSTTPGDGAGQFVNTFNPKLELYDPSGTLIASGSALADGRNEQVLHTATAAGNYRLRVLNEGVTFGEYFVSVTGNTATTVPPYQVTTTNPANGAQLLVEPTIYTVNFNNSILPSTLQASDLLVNGMEATSVTFVDGDTASFTLPTGLVDGTYTVSIAEGTILDIQNAPVQAFSATFELDTVVPTVTATSIAPNAVLAPGSLTYVVTFSEPIKVTNILSAGDFTLHGNHRQVAGVNYTPTNFSFNPAGTELTLNFASLPDDDYTLTLVAGANGGTNFTDVAGNAMDGEFSGTFPSGNGTVGGNFVIGFDMDVTTEPFVTLNAKSPLGSLVYDGSIVRTLSSASDVDDFTIQLDPNQTISITVSPSSTLQPSFELFDPSNVLIASSSAASQGFATSVQTIATTTGGTYRIAVSGFGSQGQYTIDVILNAAFELEGKVASSTNNTSETAQDINSSFINVDTTLATARRAAVLGATDALDYAVSAVTPTFTDISTTGTRSTSAINDDAVDTIQVAQLAGFTFPLFGTTYNAVSFSTNGLVTFGGTSFDFTNTNLSSSPSQATIAVLWDDLNIDNTGTGTASRAIYWQVVGSGASQQLIIQWNNVRLLSGTVYFTFQAVLSRDGSVQFNYAPTVVSAVVTGATVGIKTTGIDNPARRLIQFNQAASALVGPNLSTRITPISLLADFYKFDVAAGETLSLGLKDLATGNLDLQLIGTDGVSVLASGTIAATNFQSTISNYAVGAAGTYFVRVNGDRIVPYSLVVTKNADLDVENNSNFSSSQSLTGTQGVLGYVNAPTSNAMFVDFESGNQGFTVDNGATGLWHLTTQRGSQTGHSSVTSFHYGREAGTYNSGQRNSGSIVSPVLSMPIAGPIAFGFNYVLQTQGSTAVDTAQVQVSADNFATFTTIASRSTNLPNSNDWRAFTADLTAFAGQNVRIRWIFDTLNNTDNSYAGWFVDDVRIGSVAEDDWYSVTVQNAGDQLRFQTSTPADGAGEFVNLLNPHIELYRPDGTLLTSGIALADGRNELIQVSAPVAGTFHVRVSAEGTASGEYFLGANGNIPNTVTAVVNRQVFYNRSTSSVFGDGSGNPENAIDPSKVALLPGQVATLANYTNYSLGLNGLVVDIANSRGALTASDFQFATSDGRDSSGFSAVVVTPTVTVLPGVGVGGSDRVKIEFANHAIQNKWLSVTVLANANTGLADDDVFYFGNAVADMFVGNEGSPAMLQTNASDTSAVRQNQSIAANSVDITNSFDVNKDGRVNATDTAIIRQNQSISMVRFFNAPSSILLASLPAAIEVETSVPMLVFENSLSESTASRSGDATVDEQLVAKLSSMSDASTIASSASIARPVSVDGDSREASMSSAETKSGPSTEWNQSIDDYFSRLGRRLTD